ncbi:hypothetical protein MXL46_07830 [Heyndrickxia sporothermodurans]|uniref:hypothetical protein n=1 Tax=Heyndrickxia sporothermodurans TaxID=46224 RepID=UPI00115BC148|nr:hypothetical protein [Heyndrickxia sporothermodurans]MEB6549004.1 hypothetical protein [Heyndrickxia sporothermodurans]
MVRWQRESRSHGTGKEKSGTMATRIPQQWYGVERSCTMVTRIPQQCYRKRKKRYDDNANPSVISAYEYFLTVLMC